MNAIIQYEMQKCGQPYILTDNKGGGNGLMRAHYGVKFFNHSATLTNIVLVIR